MVALAVGMRRPLQHWSFLPVDYSGVGNDDFVIGEASAIVKKTVGNPMSANKKSRAISI
jgi:hypothetical protein